MKYIIGFIIGVVVTSLYFMWQIRRDQAQQQIPKDIPAAVNPIGADDFQVFYQRFHEDSVYQINHITFPLEGLPPQADSLTFVNGYRWEKLNWRMQKSFNIDDGEFNKKLSSLGGIMIEQITDKAGQFGIQRRFTKIGEEWHLIYYAAMNRIGGEAGS